MFRALPTLALAVLLLPACLPEFDEPEPRAAYGDAEAIAEMMAAGLREGMQAFKDGTAAAPAMTPAAGNICQPDKLIPVTPCADGGNIYTTINLRCNEPSGCCGNDPPCEQDEMTLAGQIGTTFNSCRFSANGHRIEIHGTIHGNLTSEAVIQCAGFATVSLKVVYVGLPSIKIDGRETCPGTINLTTQAFVGSKITVLVSGQVCDWPVSLTFDDGCVQTCDSGHCCPAGAACGTTSDGACFRPGYTVDCGNNRACPTGTTCINNGEKCQF